MEIKKEQTGNLPDDVSTGMKTQYPAVKVEPLTINEYLRQPNVKNESSYKEVKSEIADSNFSYNTFASDSSKHRSTRKNTAREHFTGDSFFDEFDHTVTDQVELEIDVDTSYNSVYNVADHNKLDKALPSSVCDDKVELHDKGIDDESPESSTDAELSSGPTIANSALVKHRRVVGDFQCPVCLQQFQNRKTMQNHKAKMHDNKIFHCDKCDKWFPTTYTFKEHVRIHSGIRPYNCDTCGRSYSSFRYLSHHATKHNESRKIHVCDVCGKRFLYPSQLQTHMSMHTDCRRYKCADCGKAYRYAPQLVIHRRLHTGERFSCDICNKSFVAKCDLKRHYSGHSDTRNFACDICGLAFKRKQYLRRHSLVHLDTSCVDAKTCDVWGSMFKLQSALNKHMEIHALNRPTLPCDLCGSIFRG